MTVRSKLVVDRFVLGASNVGHAARTLNSDRLSPEFGLSIGTTMVFRIITRIIVLYWSF